MYPYYPNTRIEPDKLTDDDVRRIREIYQNSGLPFDKLFLNRGNDAYMIQKEMEQFSYVERRPVMSMDIGKVLFYKMKAGDGKEYIDVKPGIPTHWYKGKKRKELENGLKKFENDMIYQFLKFYSLDDAKKMLDI